MSGSPMRKGLRECPPISLRPLFLLLVLLVAAKASATSVRLNILIFQGSGLAISDSLLAINGKKVDKVPSEKFRAFIVESFLTPEPPVFTVIRNGRTLDIPVRIACAPPSAVKNEPSL